MAKAICYKCNHKWDYRGESKHYLTCPKCLYKIRVDKALGKLPNGKSKELPNYLPNFTYLPNRRIEPVVTLEVEEPKKEIEEFTNLCDFNLATFNSSEEVTITQIPFEYQFPNLENPKTEKDWWLAMNNI